MIKAVYANWWQRKIDFEGVTSATGPVIEFSYTVAGQLILQDTSSSRE